MNNYTDFLLPFEIKGSAIRGRITRLTNVWKDIRTRHNYPESVNCLLSQTSILSVLFSSLVNYEGIFTLQVMSENGAVGTLVTDVTSDSTNTSNIRAVARFDENQTLELDQNFPTEDLIKTLMPKGQMIFTIDQGKHTDRYQTITALGESTLEDSALNYFKQSDQVDTFIKIFTNGEECAGLILQKMPDSWRDDLTEEQTDDIFFTIKALASTIKQSEILSPKLSGEELLYRLFNEFTILTFEEKKIADQCRCSKEKVKNSLSGFPTSEIQDLIDETSNQIEVKCEFCSRIYHLDPKDILKVC